MSGRQQINFSVLRSSMVTDRTQIGFDGLFTSIEAHSKRKLLIRQPARWCWILVLDPAASGPTRSGQTRTMEHKGTYL